MAEGARHNCSCPSHCPPSWPGPRQGQREEPPWCQRRLSGDLSLMLAGASAETGS